jgi:hypothetical protein
MFTGPISSNTLSPAAIADAKIDALHSLATSLNGDELDALNLSLDDLLEQWCPPFHYYGTYNGDGADIGFWLDQDSLNEALIENVVFSLEAGTEWDVSSIHPDSQYVLEITDHGNITLKDLDGNELWSYV